MSPRRSERKRARDAAAAAAAAEDDDHCPAPTALSGYVTTSSQGIQPTDKDIILGRGILHVARSGNARYYELIDAYMSRYDAAPTKGAKTRIVRAIFQQLQERGARFLKRDKHGTFYVIEPKHAKKKISHAIRYRQRNQQDEQKPREVHNESEESEQEDNRQIHAGPLSTAKALSQGNASTRDSLDHWQSASVNSEGMPALLAHDVSGAQSATNYSFPYYIQASSSTSMLPPSPGNALSQPLHLMPTNNDPFSLPNPIVNLPVLAGSIDNATNFSTLFEQFASERSPSSTTSSSSSNDNPPSPPEDTAQVGQPF